MRDPQRWIDAGDAPAGMHELLAAAQKAGPTAAQKAALGAKLGVASGLWLVPALKVLTVSAVVAGGVWIASPPAKPAAADSDPAPSTQATEPRAAVAVPVAVSDEPTAEMPSAQEPGEETKGPASDLVRSAPSATTTPKRKLSSAKAPPAKPSEASLLSHARAAIESKPSQSLALLAQHERLYPRGILAEERKVLKMRALRNAGKERQAAQEKANFQKEHPDSVHFVQ